MATINSVDLYLSKASYTGSGWNLYVDIHAVTQDGYEANPTAGAKLGSKALDISNIPVHGSEDWVTFTFNTPITISNTGFFSIHLWGGTSKYQMGHIRWYGSGGWSDAIDGAPLEGDERFWTRNYGANWQDGRGTGNVAYRINCTDCDDNSALSPLDTYNTAGAASIDYGMGVRTYLVAGAGPGKAWDPTPADDRQDVRVRGIDELKWFEWQGPSGETPDYKLYFRQYGGAWVHYADIPYTTTYRKYELCPNITIDHATIYEWRVDTVANSQTTTGDTWTFTGEPDRRWTEFNRRSDYATDGIAEKVWQPGTGWVDPEDFEYTGGGRYKNRIVVVGHKVIYFGDV